MKGDTEAQVLLGSCYDTGKGVPEDPKQATEWFRKAAEQGNVMAQYIMGLRYEKGRGVPKDTRLAVEWYVKAAKQGDVVAQYTLGSLYENGEGVPKDLRLATEWYRKAAGQGHASAQFRLGGCYYFGEGVPKDPMQAAEWYRKAAEQGHAMSQFSLGLHYKNGEGVPLDLVQAYMWMNLAAAQGHEKAAKCRTVLEQMMTQNQIAEAQRLAAAFVPRSFSNTDISSASDGAVGIVSDKLVGSGTGFFVTTNGWLVTNAHVATAGSRAMVKLGDNAYPAAVKQVDAANDLALIKVEGQFHALALERAGRMNLGVSIFTIGFPNPGLQGYSPKMTKGEISSLAGIKDDPRYFQISAPIQPGNSGGALADVSGNVVGVVTAMISDKAAIETTGAIPQNVNYAIKSTYLLALLESNPEVAKSLKGPVKTQDFAAAVQTVEKASAMVLMFE